MFEYHVVFIQKLGVCIVCLILTRRAVLPNKYRLCKKLDVRELSEHLKIYIIVLKEGSACPEVDDTRVTKLILLLLSCMHVKMKF